MCYYYSDHSDPIETFLCGYFFQIINTRSFKYQQLPGLFIEVGLDFSAYSFSDLNLLRVTHFKDFPNNEGTYSLEQLSNLNLFKEIYFNICPKFNPIIQDKISKSNITWLLTLCKMYNLLKR